MSNAICNVSNCNRERSALGMCNLHYQRHIHGRPLIQDAKPTYETCTVDGCSKQTRTKHADKCAMHYHRLYRYGTLETYQSFVERPTRNQPAPTIRRRTDLSEQRFGTLTVMEPVGEAWLCQCDCGETRIVHTGELHRTGDSNTCGVKHNHLTENADYNAAHGRVKSLRGTAKEYRCVDCGRQGKHWSYDHADPEERSSQAERTLGIAYSLDTDHYQPRCVPCHKRFDLGHINSTPPAHVAN